MYENVTASPMVVPESKLGNQVEMKLGRGDFDLLSGLAMVDVITVADEIRSALNRALSVWVPGSPHNTQTLRSEYEPFTLRRREATTSILFKMATAHELSLDALPGYLKGRQYRNREAVVRGAIRGYLYERLNEPDFEAQIHAARANLHGQQHD